jgi:hypothetical protein
VAVAVAAGPAAADDDDGGGPRGLRLSLGPALALDPAFVAAAGGLDWFFGPRGALGVVVAHTVPAAGDRRAAESSYGFATVTARLRAPAGPRLSVEVAGGAGVARTRFGTPGAHTRWDGDVMLGGGVGLRLGRRLEVAAELAMHAVLAGAAAGRNALHTSEVISLAVRAFATP